MKKSQSSDYINGLEKTLGIDKEGNVSVGKNLKIDGTTKLNGGLTPILIKDGEYQTDDGTFTYSVLDFGEFKDTGNNILGLIINDEFELIGIGSYKISGTTSDSFGIYGVSMVNNNFEYIHLDNSEIGSGPIYERVAFMESTQPKLYTHTITLTSDKSYTLIYSSTNNLKVKSVSELRTIMNVTATSDNVILPVCASDLSGTAVLQVTTALCKIGTANVTAVTDKITTL